MKFSSLLKIQKFSTNFQQIFFKKVFNFVENTEIFAKLNKKNITSPHVYWFMAEKVHPNLSKLAQRLLKIPASSAGIERLFSNWSFIHSDLRNCLSAERSQKLIEIYYSLKMKYELY